MNKPPSVDKRKTKKKPNTVSSIADTNTGKTLKIEIPAASSVFGDPLKSVDVRMNRQQAETYNRLRFGLIESKEKLKNGKLVRDQADVLRWILENLQ